MLSSGIKYFSIVSGWLHSPTNPLFLAHYLICINIFMCFQVSTTTVLAPQPELASDWLLQCFQWHQIFFASMDTVSCWVDQLSQWESCAGSCLSDSAPGLRSSPPSLDESTRWLSGGVQNNNKAVVGLSVVPRTCQHSWVLLQPLRGGGFNSISVSDTLSQHFILSLLSYHAIIKPPVTHSNT